MKMTASTLFRKISPRTIGVFLLVIFLCFLLIFITVFNRIQVERLTMEQLISEKSVRINDVMLRLLHRTHHLAMYIQHNYGEVRDFAQVASMFVDDPAILNILMAPDGVVTDIFPSTGNEAVLGLDFFSEGAGNAEAVMSKETRQLVLGGPFMGVQGEMLIVGRLPVFINDPDGQERFWGIVSVTLAYPQALYGAGLVELEIMGFDYEIWRVNPDDQEMQLIASSDHNISSYVRYIERQISILNADWYFRILTVRAWYTFPETWIPIVASIILSLLFAVVVQSYDNTKKMKALHDKSILEKHMVAMKLLVSSLEQQDNTARQHRKEASLFRHDIRHTASMILFSMANGDNEGARKLINDIDANIRRIESAETAMVITGHSLIDAVLCHCIDEGKASGITVDVQMQSIENLSADRTELAVTIANALENALNACKKIPPDGGRVIKITGTQQGRQYFIEVANTYVGKILFDPITELPLGKEEGHGFGTQSIAFFAQKYEGVLQYECEDHWLRMRLLI